MVNVLRITSTLLIAAAIFGLATADNVKCTGLNYNIRAGPDGATPDVKCKSAAQIATELVTLKATTDVIRLHSLTDCNQVTALVPVAIDAGLKIELGLLVDSSVSIFEAEKTAFKALLQTGLVTVNNIVGIHVGNEAVHRGDVTVSVAISNLNEIRVLCQAVSAAASIPLTIADIGDTYSAYPELIKAVDYVSINYFPFWDEVDIGIAADCFYERFSALAVTANVYGKKVVVGEIGWASDGTGAGASIATEVNAAKFFYDIYTLAVAKGFLYYYFTAFDELWKLDTVEATKTVEAYFGLFTKDGILKPTISAKLDLLAKLDVSVSLNGSSLLNNAIVPAPIIST